MTEEDERGEAAEPQVTDVPEPDQDPHEPVVDDELDEAEEAAQEPAAPSEAVGPTPEQINKLWDQTERATNTYVKKITNLWEHTGLALIPLGLDPASPLGFVQMENAGRIDSDTKDAALEFLGFTREQDYEPDPDAHECDTCKGKGLTATGSHVGANKTRDCPVCRGLGYTVSEGASTNGSTPVSSSHVSASEQVTALATGEVDNWGEPRVLPNGERNHNFGLQPQYKVPHPTYGNTAHVHERAVTG